MKEGDLVNISRRGGKKKSSLSGEFLATPLRLGTWTNVMDKKPVFEAQIEILGEKRQPNVVDLLI